MRSIAELFSTYKFEAFRLELLPIYCVPGEWENYLHYKQTGVPKQTDGLIKYIEDGRSQISIGKRHIRARVVPNPITDYFIFETKIGYLPQSRNGFENIFLDEQQYRTLMGELKEDIDTISDFWLFDKETVVEMKYDVEGKYLGNNITEDCSIVEKCVKIRDAFISVSYPFSRLRDQLVKELVIA